MPTTLNKFLLILILILALFLRAYHLDSYPPINPDEASIGYNAFSLIKTGKDEHGSSWPLHFKSFGDYKPGGYIYLTLPFVELFGLNLLSVRLPNLILSLLTLYFFYRLVVFLTKNHSLSLIALLVLTLNPWHIHFSRGGWESSAALSFIVIGTFLFFKQKYLLFIITFILSIYTYHSARIIAPLLGICYLYIDKSYFLNYKSKLIKLLLIAILISLPVIFSFLNNGGTARFSGVGLTADTGPLWRANELLSQHQPLTLPSRIIHNQRVLYLFSWVEKYFSHFDLNYLFTTGDQVPRSKVPNMGQFYLFELPFLLIGIYYFLHNKYFKNHKIFIILWLIISPLASSLTFQAPSALRSLPLIIPLTILISTGIYHLLLRLPKIFIIIVGLLYFFSLANYLNNYHIIYPKVFPQAWSQGFSQVIPFLSSNQDNYKNVYFTDKYDQPYILYLFYTKYDPSKIQPQIKLTPPDQFGFSTVRQIDNIIFEKINWDNILPNSLVIASDEPVPIDPSVTLDFPNGTKAFKIYIKP